MKTTLFYDHYYDWDELTASLKLFAHEYPSLVHLESLVKSAEGKDVWALSITDPSFGTADQKPAYYIDANIHAGEVTGSACALYVIDTLCSNFENDPAIAKLLQDYTFYILPMISPDGVDTYLHSFEKLRSVNRNYPCLEKEDGLHPSDIDNDGVIRMMRVQSPYGSWKPSADNANVMVRRLATDNSGDFYHVYPEGTIVNYDGINVHLAKNKWGLDFNRNFPFGWFSEVRQPGAGAYPLSNTETKAMADFILAHPNIGFVSALHTTGGVIVYPPGTHPEKQAIQADMKLYHSLDKTSQEITGYPFKNIFDEFLVDTVNYSSGAFDDWCYEVQGIPAVTVELWDLLLRAGATHSEIRADHTNDILGAKKQGLAIQWLIDHDLGDHFKSWQPFEHPQLGSVEIGGFDFKFSIQNPPPHYLHQEIAKMAAFLLESAKSLPKLVLESVNVQPISATLSKITAIIGNTGYLATNLTHKALELKISKPITVQLNGAKAHHGLPKIQTIDRLIGHGEVDTKYAYDGIVTLHPAPQRKAVEWLVETEGNALELVIHSEKAGTITAQISCD